MSADSDHPHARGENVISHSSLGILPGPSPRAWGEQYRPAPLAHSVRTIPTRVGRTVREPPLHFPPPDHPHARGENVPTQANDLLADGPSPRAWGERHISLFAGYIARTIPTRVGRTISTSSAGAFGPDHPHARGENGSRTAPTFPATGPSPRAWGERPYSSQ